MKNFNLKSLICGLLIGTIGTIGTLSIINVGATEKIKSAKYENFKVSFNNSSIPLKDPLVSIIKTGEKDSKTYMPVKEILEYLGYDVKCNTSVHSINIEKKEKKSIVNNGKSTPLPKNKVSKNIAENQGDKLALEIMQKTGNWSYVEPLLSYMTPKGVTDVFNLYINEKGGNKQKAESASYYMNKDNFTTDKSNQLITQSDYDNLASKSLSKTNDMFSILVYLPHMSTNKINSMVKDYIDKTNDFNCIYNIREYMSIKAIDDTVKNYINKTGDYGTVASMLEFMSADASNHVAKNILLKQKTNNISNYLNRT